MEEVKRKGARSQKEVPAAIIEQLNAGAIESVNLTEWLCVNHIELIKHVLPTKYQQTCTDAVLVLKSMSVMNMIKCIGETLMLLCKEEGDTALFATLKNHQSDSVRCWAAYMIGSDDSLTVFEKLEGIEAFATDSHFGVREIAWMAVRKDITDHLTDVLPILEQWSTSANEYSRRFAVESIRPNGVWCKKLDALKEQPELAQGILDNVKTDTAKYVQDSVGNWLNDAGKTRPDFVLAICDRWAAESNTKETAYIIKRAKRSLK